MKPTQAVIAVTAGLLKAETSDFGVGDSVRVSVKVVEGSRERTQVFEGVVMRSRGGGINANFTVRRIASHGIGVERTFLLHSPRIEKIEVTRRGVVRRAQIYYLRGLTGKAARIKERRYRPAVDAKGNKVKGAPIMAAPEAVEPEVMEPAVMEPEMMAAEAPDAIEETDADALEPAPGATEVAPEV